MKKYFKTSEYGIDNSGKKCVTDSLQKLIDEAGNSKGVVVIEKGVYLTAPLFLMSNMEFIIDKEAVILGTTDESQISEIYTRVAGIDMYWYPGIINCNCVENVIISGKGKICGQGSYWWNKYWGTDMTGGLRKEYDQCGLRWAADYDCKRMRNVVVSDSSNVVLKEFTSEESGFWNVHVVYSKNIHIDDIKIKSDNKMAPSTDGIDIDSCEHVLVENCETSCNDDSICIKSGRDMDGFKTGIPCHDVIIRNCHIKEGFGITIGSEVSGGIYDIKIENITFENTDCGFRIKSSRARKGYIKNVKVTGLYMTNVKYPFHIKLDWNPAYSICKLPKNPEFYSEIIAQFDNSKLDIYNTDERNTTLYIPKHWKKLIETFPEDISNTKVSEIFISNVISSNTGNYTGISRAFNIEGFADQPLSNIELSKINLNCKEYGVISYVKDIVFKDVNISVSCENNKNNDEYDNR